MDKSVSPADVSAPAVLSPSDRTVAILLLLVAFVTSAASLPGLFAHGSHSGQFIGVYSLQWVLLLSIVILATLAELALLLALSARPGKRVGAAARRVITGSFGLKKTVMAAGFALSWALYVFLVLYRFENNLPQFLPRAWLFLLFTALGALFLSALFHKSAYFWSLMAAAILYGAGIAALAHLRDISHFPFSIGWSEASRYYYASLPLARWLYGIEIPLSPWHPSRYYLQGLAFLFSDNLILVHRLWQSALWVGMPLLTGWLLARRLRCKPEITLLAAIWSALVLQQGPVYYHLLVCVALVLWGFDARRFWRTLAFVALASMWAGISRVNWMPVPAFLAAALYILDTPVSASRGWLRYLLFPVAWAAAGAAAALLSQATYLFFSGHEDISGFGSVYTSALLWYRLLPNPTYPMGVLPAIMLVSLPLLILIGGNWARLRSEWHIVRRLGLAGMALVLFLGGLVVSTKIGGGSNIHNMDAFLVLLLVTGGSIGFRRFASESGSPATVWRPWPLLLFMIMTPVIWNINVQTPFVQRDLAQAEYDLGKLSAIAQEYAGRGEVLFITQRQLLVFGLIPNVPLTPDYELLTLSEMAISNNQNYLSRFAKDLESRRFSLIVMDFHSGLLKDPMFDSFSEENNAWKLNIMPLLQPYYQVTHKFDTQGIELLIPRSQ